MNEGKKSQRRRGEGDESDKDSLLPASPSGLH